MVRFRLFRLRVCLATLTVMSLVWLLTVQTHLDRRHAVGRHRFIGKHSHNTRTISHAKVHALNEMDINKLVEKTKRIREKDKLNSGYIQNQAGRKSQRPPRPSRTRVSRGYSDGDGLLVLNLAIGGGQVIDADHPDEIGLDIRDNARRRALARMGNKHKRIYPKLETRV